MFSNIIARRWYVSRWIVDFFLRIRVSCSHCPSSSLADSLSQEQSENPLVEQFILELFSHLDGSGIFQRLVAFMRSDEVSENCRYYATSCLGLFAPGPRVACVDVNDRHHPRFMALHKSGVLDLPGFMPNLLHQLSSALPRIVCKV